MHMRRDTGRVPVFLLVVVAAIAAGLGLWLGLRGHAPPQPPPMQSAQVYPQPRPLPAFALTQSDGKPLTVADWQGRYTLVFFGYTRCPDICPTTLATLHRALQQLRAQEPGTQVQVDFISVDPQRDTLPRLAAYVRAFDPGFIGATGPDAQLQPLTRALGVVYARTPDGHGGESIDHSGVVVLIDPHGRELAVFLPPLRAAAIADDLARLIAWRR
ncbi:MAG: SCO family protein [Xanthomonadaceae bacterium]|nr:SCO family protein [Xanthomonadaceae bacterium]MDE1958072.1 SCO family protein [Xanthomonadaceae bacterium]MDE2177558.1 SCO family protein [Xanthomonadaceae bacterium]MDE2244693.1 SCO family protein [Xanthomonadaceae bacterium]